MWSFGVFSRPYFVRTENKTHLNARRICNKSSGGVGELNFSMFREAVVLGDNNMESIHCKNYGD